MTTEFIDLRENMTIEDALERIRKIGTDTETIYTCYYEAIRYTITQAINNKTIIPITKSLSK